ncbi:hypothetical protein [Rhodoplanes sp. Z2-YC6860]|uniref:hypothetical protein n=1 Tax=Rhodoplanes sp. Z2-YC6860 TaxID=674703 RepID=UPI0012ECE7E5|nr:hypothetical protein [Rhodoplanes sp. Z2-YC6860]
MSSFINHNHKITRVLLAGNDSGGLNVIAPLLREWNEDSRFTPHFLAGPRVRREFRYRLPGIQFAPGADELTERLCHRPGELDGYLRGLLLKGRYDVVVCGTSANALLEKRLLHTARSLGVPCVAICDMWWAYTERFHDGQNWTLPDRLWVLDDAMRVAAEQVAWPSKLAIDVVGSPFFAQLMRRRMNNGGDTARTIRYISEPVSTSFPEAGINEFALADMLVSAMATAKLDAPIVFRPHPADSIEAWRRWTYARRAQGVSLDTLPLEEAIADTRLAVGISSIMLAELRICGVPAASLQPTGVDRNYYCLPFEDLEIARIPDEQRLADWLILREHKSDVNAAAIHYGAIERATDQILSLVSASTTDVNAQKCVGAADCRNR